MTVANPQIPLTGPAFPREEYERRWQRVLVQMERAGMDVLAVTANGPQAYLGGYDGSGGCFAAFPIFLGPGQPPPYVVRKYDEDAVRAESCIDEIVPYTQEGDFGKACADVLRRFGLEHGR